MAEALKDQFGEDIPQKIAMMLVSAFPEFDSDAFIQACLCGYNELELTARARHICEQMGKYLPEDFSASSSILIRSLDSPLNSTKEFGMGPFLYLPHVFYAAEYGLKHFEDAMELQYQLTQRFTAEFSIRAFIQAYPQQTLERLHQWCSDPSPHVRRLVSEGTRPRLPWAGRLPEFQKDPTAVFELLEKLKDDDSLYVRRSVANNLNDIYKDNPALVNKVAEKWLKTADKNRLWVVTHALRSAVKAGDKQSLAVLGYGPPELIEIEDTTIHPQSPEIGQTVAISCVLKNEFKLPQSLMVDAKVYFIKANGQPSAKVFKLKQVRLKPGQQVEVNKKIALKQLTTRTHYPGKHQVSVLLNGNEICLGSFNLLPAKMI